MNIQLSIVNQLPVYNCLNCTIPLTEFHTPCAMGRGGWLQKVLICTTVHPCNHTYPKRSTAHASSGSTMCSHTKGKLRGWNCALWTLSFFLILTTSAKDTDSTADFTLESTLGLSPDLILGLILGLTLNLTLDLTLDSTLNLTLNSTLDSTLNLTLNLTLDSTPNLTQIWP